jgi:hypothetical protein
MKMDKRGAWWPRERAPERPPVPVKSGTISVPELRRLVAEMID